VVKLSVGKVPYPEAVMLVEEIFVSAALVGQTFILNFTVRELDRMLS
jgi:hypothetical protein